MLKEQNFILGKHLTAIVGRNKTLKSTLLGIITQPFTITDTKNPLYGSKTLDGYNFRSQFFEKYKFDINEKAGDHYWETTLHDDFKDFAKYNPYPQASIYREKSTSNAIRLWHPKDRSKGSGYIQIPVYFLSLSRLFPIGETSATDETLNPTDLTKAEKELFNQEYCKILSDMDENIQDITTNKEDKITLVGVKTDKYSQLTNSAGQSNVSKIVLSVLSFKRLKDTFKQDYKGGILGIDELDATLHPSAQRHLVKFLHKYSKLLNLQIIFTTHSEHILNELRDMVLQDQDMTNNVILHLKKNTADSYIQVKETKKLSDFNAAIADLNLTPYEKAKLNVFCEDNVTQNLLKKAIGTNFYKRINTISPGIGYAEYMNLHKTDLKEFQNALIILDGDVKKENDKIKKWLKDSKNVMLLPDETCPEISFYNMLQNDKNFAIFNTSRKSEDDKAVLFQDFIPTSKPKVHKDEKEFCKRWFKTLSNKDKTAIYSTWKKVHTKECDNFKENFKQKFNSIADKIMIEPIE